MAKTHRNHVGGDSRRTRVVALLIGLLLLIALAAVGSRLAYVALRDLWREQCRLNSDAAPDVVITTGKYINPEVISYHFGLTNGANIATIPFDRLRARLLQRVPNIRDIRIELHLPDRVVIDVMAREPVARLIRKGRRGETGRVVDAENVVFRYGGKTDHLPLICESAIQPATPPGQKLTGLPAAATHLITAVAEPEFADLRVLEIDATPQDYLMLKLGNTDRVMFAWEYMLKDSAASQEKLRRQLKHLMQAIATNLTPPSILWNAKEWKTNRIFADPNRNGTEKGKLP